MARPKAPAMTLIHGSSVMVAGAGVLIRGPSGGGKSDLALRLIDQGALLVADDQTRLTRREDGLRMSCPAAIAGLLEVRGLGIVRLPYRAAAPLRLVVDLVPEAEIERLPDPEPVALLGLALPRLRLCPWQASAPAKVRLAVGVATGLIMPLS
ncbi:HPr kinase/phosphorylase [mine drainage metagenome]|uniref:HPr kinase/phosphorylase n=1 Tax=mine drainage metagenome TaxID=410659 RepID=A0A1J5SVB9_9ZZZZ